LENKVNGEGERLQLTRKKKKSHSDGREQEERHAQEPRGPENETSERGTCALNEGEREGGLHNITNKELSKEVRENTLEGGQRREE